jgi:(p)ppGpp synthase/HD superfamily hydrolase
MSRLAEPSEQTAALLHDVIADSDLTLDDFRAREYDPEVVEALDRLNRRDAESFEDFIERIRQHQWRAALRSPTSRTISTCEIGHQSASVSKSA